jgi:hypothetical protein
LSSPGVKAVLDIDKVSLSQIIKWNTGVVNLQENVFFDRSVLVFEAPDSGSNVSLIASGNLLTLFDNTTDSVLAVRSLSGVSQVVLVGSSSGADVFNLYLGGAGGGIENGVTVYGGGTAGDRLNVYGRLLQSDTFTVSGETISADTTTAADDAIVLPRAVDALMIDINGNDIFGTGFETLRLVKQGGNDTVIDPQLLAQIVLFWNPDNPN